VCRSPKADVGEFGRVDHNAVEIVSHVCLSVLAGDNKVVCVMVVTVLQAYCLDLVEVIMQTIVSPAISTIILHRAVSKYRVRCANDCPVLSPNLVHFCPLMAKK